MSTINYPQETKAFWQKHITACQESKRSKASYAKSHELDYHRFLYWIGRLKKTNEQNNGVSTKLLPIKITPHPQAPIVASIKIDGGHCIDLYDLNVLLQLLKQLKPIKRE